MRGTWRDLTDGARRRLLAEDRAAGALDPLGYPYGALRSTATDMDTMKVNRPSRR